MPRKARQGWVIDKKGINGWTVKTIFSTLMIKCNRTKAREFRGMGNSM